MIDRGSPARRAVALTFDAGSDLGYTEQILDILERRGISADFGITGRWAQQHPEAVRQIVASRHGLINHSWDHRSFTGLSTATAPLTRAQRWEQLDRTDAELLAIAGTSSAPYFRPPFGDYDASVAADVGARGYAFLVMWTVDSGGWQGLAPEVVVRRCLDRATPGAIYVFHVGSASTDALALERILDGLAAEGYAFLPLRELLR